MSEAELLDVLAKLETHLRDASTVAEAEGHGLFARNLEIWAHVVAMARSEVDPEVDHPGTLAEYLDLPGAGGNGEGA